MKPALALFLSALALAPPTLAQARPFRSSVGSYTNSNGRQVSGPKRSLFSFLGSKAKCRDGSSSYSKHKSGTCSSHGGVR